MIDEDYIKNKFDKALAAFLEETKVAHQLTLEAMARARSVPHMDRILHFHETRRGMLEALIEALQGMLDDGSLPSIEKYVEMHSCSHLTISIGEDISKES